MKVSVKIVYKTSHPLRGIIYGVEFPYKTYKQTVKTIKRNIEEDVVEYYTEDEGIVYIDSDTGVLMTSNNNIELENLPSLQ